MPPLPPISHLHLRSISTAAIATAATLAPATTLRRREVGLRVGRQSVHSLALVCETDHCANQGIGCRRCAPPLLPRKQSVSRLPQQQTSCRLPQPSSANSSRCNSAGKQTTWGCKGACLPGCSSAQAFHSGRRTSSSARARWAASDATAGRHRQGRGVWKSVRFSSWRRCTLPDAQSSMPSKLAGKSSPCLERLQLTCCRLLAGRRRLLRHRRSNGLQACRRTAVAICGRLSCSSNLSALCLAI